MDRLYDMQTRQTDDDEDRLHRSSQTKYSVVAKTVGGFVMVILMGTLAGVLFTSSMDDTTVSMTHNPDRSQAHRTLTNSAESFGHIMPIALNESSEQTSNEARMLPGKIPSISEIRFNKCPPVTNGPDDWYQPSPDYPDGVHVDIYPLMPHDYPIRGKVADILKFETLADSVVTRNDIDLDGVRAREYLEQVGKPHYPTDNPNGIYWNELRQVVEWQLSRRANADPATLTRWPDLWAGYDQAAIAEAVNNEYPGSIQQEYLKILFKGGIVMDYTVLPYRSVVNFVGAQVRIAAINTWAIETIAAPNFLLKWHVGMPRPEEVAWLIASGQFTANDGAPPDVVEMIQSMTLQKASDFTAYMKGSPKHPSWPAMHSAASILSYWLPVVAKLTPEQYCESLRVDWAVAYARTVAGVHYGMDNLAGLNIGQYIIKKTLPSHLATTYDADKAMIKEKLEKLSFDWNDFDPYSCTIANVPVGDRLL